MWSTNWKKIKILFALVRLDLSIFQVGGSHHPGFFKILTVGRLKRVELRRRAKFGRNRSNCGRDMAIFRFFQDGGCPPCWICCVWTTHERHLVVFIAVQTLAGIGAVVLIICMFSISRVWLENAYSRPQNWGFGGILPLNGEQCQRNPKSTSVRESASFEQLCAKIRRRVWPVGEFPKKGYLPLTLGWRYRTARDYMSLTQWHMNQWAWGFKNRTEKNYIPVSMTFLTRSISVNSCPFSPSNRQHRSSVD